MNNNLFKKFVEFAFGNGVVLILGFISSPITTRLISPNEMGKFSMFNTFTNLLLVILLLGLDQSYGRYYYEEEEEDRIILLKRCINIPLIVNFILSIILILFYKSISLYIVEEESIIVIFILIVYMFFSIINRFALLNIRMKQKSKTYSLINILMKLLNIIGILILFNLFKDNYITMVGALVLATVVTTLIMLYIEKEDWFKKKKGQLKTEINEIIKYGIPFIFSMAITWIFQSIDRISIKQFSGYSELGLYSGAMTIISLLNAFQGAFTTFWIPVAYEKYINNKEDKEFFTKVNKYITVSMIFIAIMLIAGKDVLVLLLGVKYRDAAFIFPYLVFMPIMYTISETTVLGINFKKKSKNHIYIAVVCAICNFLGNVVLVPILGATGAAISTGISYIVFFAMRTWISNKYYKVNYNLNRMSICIIFTYLLATYSSFNKFNIIIFMLTILSLAILCYLYRDVIKELCIYVKDIKRKLLRK